MEKLSDYTMQFYSFLRGYLSEDGVYYLFLGVLGFFLVLGFFMFFYLLKKEQVVQKSIQNAYEKMDIREKLRSKKEYDISNAEIDTQNKKSIMRKINRKLQYSGLQEKFPFLTSELYILIILGSMTAVFFLVQLITKSFFMSLVFGGITVLIFTGIEILLSYRNYVKTEKDLLNLLNIIKNYSLSADEITLILFRTAAHVGEPIRSALVECHYESTITGNASDALIHLMNKLEHPKFKELIRNIEICGRYDADYTALLANHKETIQNFISSREEQKSSNHSDIVTFTIVTIGAVILLLACGNMAGVDMLDVTLHTQTGHIFGILMGLDVVAFLWKVVLFDKD